MKSESHPPLAATPATLRTRDAVASAVLEFLQSRPGELLSLIQIIEGVSDKFGYTPTDSGVRSAIKALVRRDDSSLLKAGHNTYVWSPDGVIPERPTPPHVARMIERRSMGKSLQDIGTEFGVTRERVRQLLKKYGGPTAAEVREVRAAKEQAAGQLRATQVARTLRELLCKAGPMSVDDAAAATEFEPDEVARCWPDDLAHLRLWTAGQNECRWSDEEILDAIRDAALYEFPLTANAYTELLSVGQIQGPSLRRVGQRFGSWSAACEAAGVVPGQAWRDNYESRWSDADLLQVLRRYLLDPNAPNSAHRFDEWKRVHIPDGPSGATLRNRFGSWTEAKRRAFAIKDFAQ